MDSGYSEYYRLKDKKLNCYLAEGYNTEDINSIKRTILKFLIDPKNDIDDLSKLTLEQLLKIEGLGLELESSYEPFVEENIGRYENDDTGINIFPKLENN